MIFENHKLNQPLEKYIESIFYYKNFMPDHSIERLVPTGHLFILFELDGFTRNTYDNETLKANNTFQKVWISGMHQNFLSISAHKNSEMLVIQFKPYGAYPFFHLPINILNNKVIHTDQLFEEELLLLREELNIKPEYLDKFMSVEKWLLGRYQPKYNPPEALISIIENIKSNATDDIKPFIEDYPKTQKHLIDQFKKYAGLTPKNLQRIYRFNEILQTIHKKNKIKWAQVAIDCGYTDQSHFIKEFKYFCGINPQEFLSEKFNKDEPNFFALDR